MAAAIPAGSALPEFRHAHPVADNQPVGGARRDNIGRGDGGKRPDCQIIRREIRIFEHLGESGYVLQASVSLAAGLLGQ